MISDPRIKLALVDDHQIVIDGLVALLKEDPSICIIATATSAREMLEILPHKTIDILLSDVVMEGMSGQELARIIRQRFPGIKIIALSMSGVGETVEEMINDADISGYLLKQTGKNELLTAIKTVHQGGIYFQQRILEELEKYSSVRKHTMEVNLTIRELEIITLLEKDLSNKQISEKCGISVRTVETHRKNILKKTGTNNVLSLIKWAYHNNILDKKKL